MTDDFYVTRTGVEVDPKRFKSKGDQLLFEPFHVTRTEPLATAISEGRVDDEDDVLLIAHDNERATVLLREQMAFHHVAHGQVDGEPWIVFFWVACNTGVSLIPKVDGVELDFRVWGLHNGVALVEDMKTRSKWDHITGECIHGEHRGKELAPGPMLQYFKAKQAARRFARAELALSSPPLRARILHRTLIRRMLTPEGYLPSLFFKPSLTIEDERRLRMERGLGVVYKGEAQRFYPIADIEKAGAIFDTLADRPLVIYIDPDSAVPVAGLTNAKSARWEGNHLVFDTGDRIRDRQRYSPSGELLSFEQPLQLFTRWYGFALTFPNCDIYG